MEKLNGYNHSNGKFRLKMNCTTHQNPKRKLYPKPYSIVITLSFSCSCQSNIQSGGDILRLFDLEHPCSTSSFH